MDKNLIWMIIGFVGQGFFSARFILQWVMSEIKKQSIIPCLLYTSDAADE